MTKPRLCIDIDNVIARTDEVMRRVIRDHTAGRVNLNYADIIEFDYHRCKDRNGCSITKDEWNAFTTCSRSRDTYGSCSLSSEFRNTWML